MDLLIILWHLVASLAWKIIVVSIKSVDLNRYHSEGYSVGIFLCCHVVVLKWRYAYCWKEVLQNDLENCLYKQLNWKSCDFSQIKASVSIFINMYNEVHIFTIWCLIDVCVDEKKSEQVEQMIEWYFTRIHY